MELKRAEIRCIMIALVCVLVGGGCQKPSAPEAPKVQELEAPKVQEPEAIFKGKPAPGSVNPRREDQKALVQVFMFGLGVFEFGGGIKEDPSSLAFHMPLSVDHTKYLRASQAVSASKYEWIDVPMADLTDTTVTFLPGGAMPALSAFHSPGAVLGDFPANSDQSRDVRWLLRSSQFDTINSFDPNGADSRVKFSSGLLETCGLVHEPGGIDEVCRVKTNRIGSTPRAMSEYMVLRFVVDDPAAFKIRLTRDDGSIKDLTIGERGGSQTVVFQDVEYLRVFDVLIAHVEPKATRIMESNHPAHIQAAMFEPQAPPAWWISSPDCSNSSGAWQCTTCKTSVQPACLKVFTDYAGAPGGLDRPICPFIEHP